MCFFQVGRLLRLFEYRQQHEIEFERRLKLAEARNTHEPDFKEEGNSMVLGNESDTRRVATSGSALATVQQQQQQPLSLVPVQQQQEPPQPVHQSQQQQQQQVDASEPAMGTSVNQSTTNSNELNLAEMGGLLAGASMNRCGVKPTCRRVIMCLVLLAAGGCVVANTVHTVMNVTVSLKIYNVV